MEDAAIEPTPKTVELVRMNLVTKKWYFGLLILTIAVLIGGIILKKYNEIIIAVPVILVLLAIIRFDKDFIHVPPLLIFFAVIVMYLSLGSALIRSDNNVLELLSEFMIGILLGSVGIIIAYMALGKMPGFANEKPFLIALESFCFGVAAAAIWNITEFYLEKAMDIPFSILSQEDAIVRLTFITLGSLFVSVMFMANSRYGLFRSMITKFLGENSDIIGIEEEDEKKEIEKLIEGGESYSLEFKSTIRTNLKTGEKDKRMEKAVLKSIVAFMNSDGGDLLVGVADDGEKIGVDVESFDNHDKMGLHITNLLSSQIGDEFIPFIKFKMLEYGQREDGTDRVVVRFKCEPTTTPVFLKDGKEEQFYVRSGPSSVELTGADLIKYIDNRRKKMKRKYIAAKKPQ
ncbi:MAG: ATP-binding protein [Candidatus Methanomethylophilaceae archaeon]|nr:ATP-binding protein [Candidatus Methanomethylophilaceae archaeon]